MKKFLTPGNILTCVAAVLGLVAVLLMFAPAISYTVEIMGKSSTATFSGVQVTFGYTEVTKALGTTVETEILKFSFMNFLSYLLALAGIVFAVLSLLGKLDKVSGLISAACFLVAGIFFFCAVPFTVLAEEKATLDGWTLGAGAIVSGILSILAAACAGAKVLLKK